MSFRPRNMLLSGLSVSAVRRTKYTDLSGSGLSAARLLISAEEMFTLGFEMFLFVFRPQ